MDGFTGFGERGFAKRTISSTLSTSPASLYKIAILLLNLVPYVALSIVAKGLSGIEDGAAVVGPLERSAYSQLCENHVR